MGHLEKDEIPHIHLKFLKTISGDAFYRRSLISYLGISVYDRAKLSSSIIRINFVPL